MVYAYTPLELWEDVKEDSRADRLSAAERLLELLLQDARDVGRQDDILRLLVHAPISDAGNAECFMALYRSRFAYGLMDKDPYSRDRRVPFTTQPQWFRKFTYDEGTGVDGNPVMAAQWRPCAPPTIEMLLALRERRKLAEGAVLLGDKRTKVRALLACETHRRLMGALRMAAELMYRENIVTSSFNI